MVYALLPVHRPPARHSPPDQTLLNEGGHTSVRVCVCVCVFVPVSACVYEMRVVWKRPEIKAVTKS